MDFPLINPLHCKNSPFVHSSEILVDPADLLLFSLLVYGCALKISPSLLLSVLRHRSWFPVSITKVCLRLLLSSGSGCNFPLTSLSFPWIPLLFPQHNLYLLSALRVLLSATTVPATCTGLWDLDSILWDFFINCVIEWFLPSSSTFFQVFHWYCSSSS